MSEETQKRSIRRRTVLQTSALALGAIASVPTVSASNGDDDRRAEVELTENGSDGTSVKVDRVRMSDGGYVSIHDVRRRLYHDDIEENGLGSQEAINDSFIGLTDYLEPGEYKDFEIPLFGRSTWALPGDPPQGCDTDRLEESQPVLAIPHYATDAPVFRIGEDGAYTEGTRTLDELPVVHDIGTVLVWGHSEDEREAAREEEEEARRKFDN